MPLLYLVLYALKLFLEDTLWQSVCSFSQIDLFLMVNQSQYDLKTKLCKVSHRWMVYQTIFVATE